MKHGSSIPASEEALSPAKRRSIPFVPDFMLRDALAWTGVFGLIVGLAAALPKGLGPQADPIASAPQGIHPEWYFMSQYQTLKVLGNMIPGEMGEWLGVGLFTLGGLVWGLVPLLDRGKPTASRQRLVARVGIAALLGLVVMTVWGYLGLG